MTMDVLLFLGFAAAMLAIVAGLVARYRSARTGVLVAAGIVVWLSYVTALWRFGVLQRADAKPPGMVFILIPVVLYLAITVFRTLRTQSRSLAAVPVAVLMSVQTFRVVVELFIHRLWEQGIVPKMLTFGGANVDIYIGATAVVFALISRRDRWGRTLAIAWNALGLLALANVVARAILTAPGPLNLLVVDPPNRMFVTFPFMFIPAFFVPLAVTLHLLALRALLVGDSTKVLPAA